MPRSRPARLAAAALAAAALALATGACSSGDDAPSEASGDATTADAAPSPDGEVRLRAGDVTVESLGDPVELDDDVRDDVLAVVQDYVDEATLRPLLDGEAGDLDGLFGDAVSERVAVRGADRGALTDDAVPTAVEQLRTDAKPVVLAALADGLGGWVAVGATIDYTVDAELTDGPVTIHRFGDLYLTPAGGDWKITAYDVAVTRETDQGEQRADATTGTAPATTAGGPTVASSSSEEDDG